MTKTQVEVITSVQRRRRWSRVEKERIVAAAIEPGAVASEVARAAGIHTSQLFRWRQELCGPAHRTPGQAPAFAAVTVTSEPMPPAAAPAAAVATPSSDGFAELEFAGGARMRISGRGAQRRGRGARAGAADREDEVPDRQAAARAVRPIGGARRHHRTARAAARRPRRERDQSRDGSGDRGARERQRAGARF